MDTGHQQWFTGGMLAVKAEGEAIQGAMAFS